IEKINSKSILSLAIQGLMQEEIVAQKKVSLEILEKTKIFEQIQLEKKFLEELLSINEEASVSFIMGKLELLEEKIKVIESKKQ
ncbi:hypothetical protein ABTK74_20255, partial [Acinetobacter baumannii]